MAYQKLYQKIINFKIIQCPANNVVARLKMGASFQHTNLEDKSYICHHRLLLDTGRTPYLETMPQLPNSRVS